MTFPTDWDIDQYRVEHECEDHWELRRSFLEAHKDKYPEDRLVCLAQVFYNVEFMGCRYPEKTMRLVAQLSQGIADEHREKTKTKLQRTFVQASDAASTKAKGRNTFGTAHTKKGFINFCKAREENDNNMTIDDNSNQDTLPNPHEEESQASNSEQLPKAKKIKKKRKSKMENVSVSTQNVEEEMVEGTTEMATTAKKNIKKRKRVSESKQNIEEKMVEDTTCDMATTANIKKKKKKKVIKNGTGKIVTLGTPQDGDTVLATPQESDILLEENPQDTETVHLPKRKKRRSKKKPKVVADTVTAKITPNSIAIPNESCFDNSTSLKRKEIAGDTVPQHPKKMKTNHLLSDFVLIEMPNKCETPYSIISRSAGQAHRNLTQHVLKTPAGLEMTLSLDGLFLARATGVNGLDARKNCAEKALEMLRESCHTIKVKDRFAGSLIKKEDTDVTGATASTPKPQETPVYLAEDSKVNRMMKLMGWGGRGLGKDQQGRENPIEVEQRVRRVGLGLEAKAAKAGHPNRSAFTECITEMLKKYLKSGACHDLVFDSDYSKEERAQIHLVARKFNLRSASYGKGQNRQLTISRKKSPARLLSQILEAGGSTEKYEVIPPGSL